MPVTFFGLDCYLFLPAAGTNSNWGKVGEWGRYWSATLCGVISDEYRPYYVMIASDGFDVTPLVTWRGHCVRLASVVSEELTLMREKCQVAMCCSMASLVILCFTKNQLQHGCLVSSSVPSCCGQGVGWTGFLLYRESDYAVVLFWCS